MGLLSLDVTRHGIVMGADSKPVIIKEAETDPSPDERDRPRILPHFSLKNFAGFLGYMGTEVIDGKQSLDWLRAFWLSHLDQPLPSFCHSLADALTDVWQTTKPQTGLWVYVSGYEGENNPRFWWANNIGDIIGDGQSVGTYEGIGDEFKVVDDLDTKLSAAGITPQNKVAALSQLSPINFRNGYLVPPALSIFDTYSGLVLALDRGQFHGFRISDLRKFAYIAHQRMEFIKRLYKPQKAIWDGRNAPFGGAVYTYAMTPSAERHVVDKNGVFKLLR